MSDAPEGEKAAPTPPPGIARAEFLQFLNERVPQGISACTVCGNKNFALNAGVGDNPIELQTPTAVGAHLFYGISCTNCGNSLFFHVSTFREWKASKTGTT